jgi:uncharacterized protein with von Willebrand factor type A (vWA) domain
VVGDAFIRRLVTFGSVLREAGLEVGPGRICAALSGLDAVELRRQEDVYWTLRQTLVSRASDLDAFDRAFAEWFLHMAEQAPARSVRLEPVVSYDNSAGAGKIEPADAAAELEEGRIGGWSPDELLREKDFSELTEDELRRLRALIAELATERPQRRTRRRRRDPRGTTLDMRWLVRASLARGGDPFERTFTTRIHEPRKLIALCDVSGSMEPYSRALLLFVHALLRSGHGVEAFAFGTRLTRLTDELSGRDPERALEQAAQRVVDWSGGTKIGASLKAFNDVWGRHALASGAVVLIVSDGWEREDTARVAREMARLARTAYAVIWVNPLKGHPDYQPLAGGMCAALPFVDRFLPGHNLASLESLAAVLAVIERRHAA